MSKTSKQPKNATPTSSSSKPLTMEEFTKKHGIPYLNTTEQYVGQSSAYFSTQPEQSSESGDSAEAVN